MKEFITDIEQGANALAEKFVQARTGIPATISDPILNEVENDIAGIIGKLRGHPAKATTAALEAGVPGPAAGGGSVLPPATADEMAKQPPLATAAKLLVVTLFVALGLTACASKPSTNHVIRIETVGTKAGVTQNPVTGVYELSVQRVQSEIVTVPVIYDTNKGEFKVTPMVSRYEISTHSGIWGNFGLTSTLATGSNAVNTALGGATPPINAGVGTGAQIAPGNTVTH